VADDVPQIMIGDQGRINQVLTNLAGNAIKFTQKGRVELPVTIGESLPGDRREISFRVTTPASVFRRIRNTSCFALSARWTNHIPARMAAPVWGSS